MIFNNHQNDIINEGIYHLKHGSHQVFEFGGLPGTGKSVVLNEIINRSGINRNRVAPMSYIGQAAIVMRLKGFSNAKTIHSWLYSPELGILTDNYKNSIINEYYNMPEMGIIFKPKELNDIDVMVIDEGYTTPLSMKDEIEKRGKKIIVAGDPGQLPPVADKPAYLVRSDIPVLTEIMRQDKYSSILYLAERARKGLPIATGLYYNVLVIEKSDLSDQMLLNSCITICGTNKTRDEINTRVRNLLGFTSRTPNIGEKIICRKNNWLLDIDGISLANGLIGTVTSQPSPLDYNNKTFRLNFRPDLFPCDFQELCCDYEYFTADFERKKLLKNNKYAQGEKFEWAYAITTHLAQGAQYPFGIYIEDYLREDINSKLNNVGITRFTDFLIYVKPNRKWF